MPRVSFRLKRNNDIHAEGLISSVKASLTSTSTFRGSVDISIKKEERERVDQGLFCFVLIGKKKMKKKTSTVFLLKLSFSINLKGV